jgi:zinc protease
MKLAGPVCLFFLALPANAAQFAAPESFMLQNGLEVVLISNPRVPAVTHMLWYKVGAADDTPGHSGLAHYNEHMMFQGTEKTGSGEFLKIVANHGGHANAFTSHDYTAYYVSIAKEHLPLIMEMEADRMLHLAPSKENFAKEREVIIEERRMVIENQPESLISEEMQAMLYRNHPYHNPNIGWMHEMQGLSREDVLAFHKQYYHPANLVLVVTGDITCAELKPLAEKYYGALPTGERYIRNWRSEPPERGPRHIDMQNDNVKQPEFLRYYSAPSVNTDKPLVAPAFVLAQILGGGQASRLYQNLVVEQKIATSIDISYNGFAVGPGELEINAVPAEGIPLLVLEEAINKAITANLAATFNNEEITRAKTLLKAESLYMRDGLEGQARALGVLLMTGLPADYLNLWPSIIDKVTESDLHKSAAAIFNDKQSVTGYLLPAIPIQMKEKK